jgi:hypothetical protein
MKTRGVLDRVRVLAVGVAWLGAALGAEAQVVTNIVNDGSSDTNLAKLCNVFGTGGAVVNLTVDSQLKILVAAQSPDYTDIPLRACWYAWNKAPAGGVYALSARLLPADASAERRVGIMGWLNLSNRVGIAFQVRPAGALGGLQVSTIDFKAAGAADNETANNLFNLDGTPAAADYGSAWSELGEYSPARYAIMSLEFSAPTADDKASLSNVTAHLTAKAFQPISRPVQVGNTVELLTDLPLPTAHRFGYFAVWGSIIVPGGTIGSFDHLTVVGEEGSLVMPPTVEITTVTNGASFTAPVDITLSAIASDPDGFVVETALYWGTNVVTSPTNQASVILRGLSAGTYSFVAKATDDSGASSVTDPVTVEVKPLLLTDLTPLPDRRNFQEFQFNVTGMVGKIYYVYYSTDLVYWNFLASDWVTEEPIVLSYPVDPAEPARFFQVELIR